jgi:metal-sulfur cluster biosynthetic enzyme
MSDSERKQSTESATVTTRAVRTALDSVLDPELDRSIVELE